MKRLFIALGLFLSLGLVGGTCLQKGYVSVHAEGEETTETETETTEEENESENEQTEEEVDLGSEISQVAKDIIEVTKEFLNRPIVIAGISTTVGALAIFIISKAVSGISKKKLNGILADLSNIKSSVEQKVATKDYDALKGDFDKLYEITSGLVANLKNKKVQAELESKLNELKPLVEEVKQFTETKVQEVQDESNNVGKKVNEIISK